MLFGIRDALGNYLQTLAQRFLADLLKGKVVVNEESIKEEEVRQNVINALLYSDVWIEKLPNP